MDWKDYEREIEGHFRQQYPSATITRDAKITGRFSEVERQIDLLVEDHASDFVFRIVVDGKYRNKRIDINDVEAFLGFLRDVEANIGVMITTEGYSQAALNRAHHDDFDLQLDILNFKDLKIFQGLWAITHAGTHAVIMPAPMGWVIDATRHEGGAACLYPRGFDLQEAVKAGTWMYVNFWGKDDKASDIDSVTALQEDKLRKRFPDGEITYPAFITRQGAKTKLRLFRNPAYPALEYTAFIEFKQFILFVVLFTPDESRNTNLRKLRHIARVVLPLDVQHESKED